MHPGEPVRTVAAFSWGVAQTPRLATLCGAERLLYKPADTRARDVDAVVVWGHKPSSRPGLDFATRHGLPLWRVEDGFLRSVGLGVTGAPPLSIVVDDLGIYYDARKPSRLERLIAEEAPDDPALLERARGAMRLMREARLSKYNASPPCERALPPAEKHRVLVVDQTAGDQSVRCGLASEASFEAMLDAAIAEHPDAEIIVKTHPDVLAGKKKGYLQTPSRPGVRVFTDDVAPQTLLAEVDEVYAVTSQLGFEALVAGRKVTCFGAPWYAGWGATDDRRPVPRRGKRRSVEQLFVAGYMRYPRYLDPESGKPGTIEDVIQHLALQRQTFAGNQGRIFCFGFRFWKHRYMRSYLKCPGNEIHFPSTAAAAKKLGIDAESRIFVWGQRETEDVRRLAEGLGVTISRVEDGFLRSVGLGSDLTIPASLVFDTRGIYYDPRAPSDLEVVLETRDFTEQEIERAGALRRRIIDSGLSKYNVGGDKVVPVPNDERRVVLVPGQVENDASVELGGRVVRKNLALIQAARDACPDAFLIFKPHPDVLSGNRRGAVSDADARAHCDHIETEATLAACLDVADEVHTMTSLVGFEALLRNKAVSVYGQPFYAGWGLTRDHAPPERRTRTLTLDELVAGTLLVYPRYLHLDTAKFTTAEVTIDRLIAERNATADRSVEMSWPRRQLRKAFFALKGLIHAP